MNIEMDQSLLKELGMGSDGQASRKAFVDFTNADALLLKELAPIVSEHADNIVDAFYDNVARYPSLQGVIQRADSNIERLKGAQKKYLLELFAGDYGESYFERRLKIGIIHNKIGLTPRWYLGSYSVYIQLITQLIMKKCLFRPRLAEKYLQAVNKIIGGLTGENSAAHQKIQEKFADLQSRLRLRFNQSAQNFYIAPQDFDDFDEIIAGDLEQEIQEIVSESIGTILNAVGDAMATSDDDDIEQRVETMAARIESIGDNIEIKIDKPADKLGIKTIQFCQNLILLNDKETSMQQLIPQLAQYDLIRTSLR